MTGVSVLASWGPWLSWGLCIFYCSGVLFRGRFRDVVWGLAELVGALRWYPSTWSPMRGRGTVAIWGFPNRNF